ncbi:hypothetical protein MTATph1_CDS0246 [Moorella phage MTATph1]
MAIGLRPFYLRAAFSILSVTGKFPVGKNRITILMPTPRVHLDNYGYLASGFPNYSLIYINTICRAIIFDYSKKYLKNLHYLIVSMGRTNV